MVEKDSIDQVGFKGTFDDRNQNKKLHQSFIESELTTNPTHIAKLSK